MSESPPDVEVRGVGEQLRLAAWWVLAGIAPVWIMVTVSIAQLGAGESVVLQGESGSELVVVTPGVGLLASGLTAAAWLAAIAAVVVPVVLLVELVSRRRAAARVTVGDVLPDALVEGAEWQVQHHGAHAAEEARAAAPTDPAVQAPPPPPPPVPPPPPALDPVAPPASDELDALFGRTPPEDA